MAVGTGVGKGLITIQVMVMVAFGVTVRFEVGVEDTVKAGLVAAVEVGVIVAVKVGVVARVKTGVPVGVKVGVFVAVKAAVTVSVKEGVGVAVKASRGPAGAAGPVANCLVEQPKKNRPPASAKDRKPNNLSRIDAPLFMGYGDLINAFSMPRLSRAFSPFRNLFWVGCLFNER